MTISPDRTITQPGGDACAAESSQPAATTFLPPSFFTEENGTARMVSLLLVLGTLIAYLPLMSNDFVSLDDRMYLTQNVTIQQGLTWRGFLWALHTTSVGYWHPLTWLVHMANVQLFGLRPAAHHLVNLAFHIFNVVLLFHILRKSSGFLWRSAMVAALFAVFPLNVESVAWAAELKTLLSTNCLLLALWAYGGYVRKPGGLRYLLVFWLFGLGLTAKPMLVTFPLLLPLLDVWPLVERTRSDCQARESIQVFRPRLLELLPLFVLSAASSFFTMKAQKGVGALISTAQVPVVWRIKNILWSYLDYIGKGIWPARLAVFYPFAGRTLSIAQVALAAIALAGISFLVWRFREKRYLMVGWLWYLITLMPVIGIVQNSGQSMADRYAYTPFWGLFAAFVWLAADHLPAAHRPGRVTLTLTAACVLLAYGAVTFMQVKIWRDSYTLFSHATQVTSRNAFAEENLGDLLMNAGRLDEAVPHYEAATQYLPNSSVVHYNLGVILEGEDRLEEAAQEYQRAIADETTSPLMWKELDNVGGVYVRLNRPADAIAAFSAAIRIDPNAPMAYKNRGLVEYSQNDFQAALEDFVHAMRLAPDARTSYWLARILEKQGNKAGAVADYEATLNLDPNLGDARTRLDALQKR